MEQLNTIDKLAGTLDRVTKRTTGTGKEFMSFTIVLTKEYNDKKYTTYVAASAFGKAFDIFKDAKNGDFVTVTNGELSSWKQTTKENNDEYYQTGVKVWEATVFSQHTDDEVSIDSIPF